MRKLLISKAEYLLMVIITLSLIFAWILELGFGMEPCSLCLLQRFGLYIALSVLVVKVIINYFINNKIINLTLLGISILGIIFSLISGLRQTYIQLLPEDKIPSCGADLETLLQIVTPFQAIKKVFEGSGECADKAFVFLGLSLANWATILFAFMTLYSIYIFIKDYQKKY